MTSPEHIGRHSPRHYRLLARDCHLTPRLHLQDFFHKPWQQELESSRSPACSKSPKLKIRLKCRQTKVIQKYNKKCGLQNDFHYYSCFHCCALVVPSWGFSERLRGSEWVMTKLGSTTNQCFQILSRLGIFRGVWLFQTKISPKKTVSLTQITFWKYNGKPIVWLFKYWLKRKKKMNWIVII